MLRIIGLVTRAEQRSSQLKIEPRVSRENGSPQLQAQGIELAAITDYNGTRKSWFIPIREEDPPHFDHGIRT